MIPRNQGCSSIGTCRAIPHSSSMNVSGDTAIRRPPTCSGLSEYFEQTRSRPLQPAGTAIQIVGPQDATAACHRCLEIFCNNPGGETPLHAVVAFNSRPAEFDRAIRPKPQDH